MFNSKISSELQAVFGFGLMLFTLEYRKTPARAIPVPEMSSYQEFVRKLCDRI
jgi:hypothetical protein